jgi:hypothetical protein
MLKQKNVCKKPVKKIRKKPVNKTRIRKYTQQYQSRETLEETDPLMLYYISLYTEKPNSEIAIKWLIKYGVKNGEDLKILEKKYEKLKKRKR